MRSLPAQRAALLDLLKLLGGSPSAVLRQGLLTDRSPDPGLFGPASVTWRIVREPLLLLSGGRALLLQVAHPLVAQGVVDHSQFEAQPFGRLLGTVNWVMEVVFGTTGEACRACERLARVHSAVKGELAAANATPKIAAATAYDALDPALGLWVHATLVDSMLLGYQTLIAPLPRRQADRFVREWNAVGALLSLPRTCLWQTADELRAYVDGRMAAGVVAPVPASHIAARTVLRPPFPWPGLEPVSAALGFITAGFLPAPLRRAYGRSWSSLDERWFRDLCRLSRRLHPYLPRRLRVSPIYDLALQRLGSGPGLTDR
jgi:uncharacterized protein (DUF2236 family)